MQSFHSLLEPIFLNACEKNPVHGPALLYTCARSHAGWEAFAFLSRFPKQENNINETRDPAFEGVYVHKKLQTRSSNLPPA